MKKIILLAVFLSGFITINPSFAIDKNTNQHKTIDGISIFLGILPAEIIEGTRISDMHGGLPVGEYRYHVTIALFNDSGNRLSNANISVQLTTSDSKSESKILEKMKFNNKLVYGNYFTLNESGPYRIKVIIKHPNYPKQIETEFEYQISRAALSTNSTQGIN